MAELYYYCDVCNISLEHADLIVHCTHPSCKTAYQGYQLCYECHSRDKQSGPHQSWHSYEFEQRIQTQPYSWPHAIPRISRMSSFSSINSQSTMSSQATYESSSSGDLQSPYNPQHLYEDPYEPMITGYIASAMFARLAAAIFHDVDNADTSRVLEQFPRGTNYLEPEKCAFIMRLLGFFAERNVFQRLFDEGQANGRGVAWSDAQVAHMYQGYGWEFHPVPRAGTRYTMPVLTENGFLQMLICEASVDPVGFSARMNGLLERVEGLIDPLTGRDFYITRERWPSVPDEAMMQKRNQVLWMVEDSIQEARGGWQQSMDGWQQDGWQQDRGGWQQYSGGSQQERGMRKSIGAPGSLVERMLSGRSTYVMRR